MTVFNLFESDQTNHVACTIQYEYKFDIIWWTLKIPNNDTANGNNCYIITVILNSGSLDAHKRNIPINITFNLKMVTEKKCLICFFFAKVFSSNSVWCLPSNFWYLEMSIAITSVNMLLIFEIYDCMVSNVAMGVTSSLK